MYLPLRRVRPKLNLFKPSIFRQVNIDYFAYIIKVIVNTSDVSFPIILFSGTGYCAELLFACSTLDLWSRFVNSEYTSLQTSQIVVYKDFCSQLATQKQCFVVYNIRSRTCFIHMFHAQKKEAIMTCSRGYHITRISLMSQNACQF